MSNIIDSIQLSGVTYQIQGSGGGGNPTVELTQAEYDALVESGAVQSNTYYIITDATAFDPSTKVDTSAFTAYSAATNTALNGKADSSDVITNIVQDWYGGTQQLYIKYKKGGNDISTPFIANGSGTTLTKSGGLVHVNVDNTTIQEKLVSGTNIKTINNESLLGSGNITIQGGGEVSSAITSGDTNAVAGGAVYDKFDEVEQVTAAALNELNDKFGGLKLVKLTQQEYDALTSKDNNTLYVIV